MYAHFPPPGAPWSGEGERSAEAFGPLAGYASVALSALIYFECSRGTSRISETRLGVNISLVGAEA